MPPDLGKFATVASLGFEKFEAHLVAIEIDVGCDPKGPPQSEIILKRDYASPDLLVRLGQFIKDILVPFLRLVLVMCSLLPVPRSAPRQYRCLPVLGIAEARQDR